jgi:hypothetical protein
MEITLNIIKMKHLKIIIMAVLSIFTFAACNDDNGEGSMSPVTNVTATPFIGSVKLSWTIPSDSNYYYTLITYNNSDGQVVHKKVGRYDAKQGVTTATVGGFKDTNAHDFVLTAFSFSGASSSGVKVTGKSEDISTAKDYVLSTVKVDPDNGGAKVKWTNESGIDVKLIISYKDMKDADICDTAEAQKSDSVVLTGMQNTTDVTVIAFNVKDGVKTSPKSYSVTPIMNPDDIIKSGVEYLTLNTGGWQNQFNLSQDNPYNQYEYTIVTTGGDPFIYINPLKSPRAGTVLKFRYKASQDWVLELFWVDAGGGAAGGRSTRVLIPASSSWTTFTHDYGPEMNKYNWHGNPGDFFRMDWGDNGGVTINMRNIHLE